jgi:putative membrane protein
MNQLQDFGKKSLVVAGTMLLCGSMGLAQMSQTPGGQSGQSTGSPGSPGQTQGMDQMGSMQQQPGQPSPTDRMFVKNAMEGSMAEVQLGQLTLQKSNNDQVKQFAQKMIDDHTKLNEQMKPVAQQLGVQAPTKLSKKDGKTLAKMQGLSGTAFDQAYIQDMVKDHKKDLSDFQMEASSGSDPTVKDAANQGSRVIAQHLQLVQQLAKDQNVTVASK